MFFEDPTAIEETMKIWQEVNKKAVEIAANNPAEVFICYENTNTGHSSTEWIEQYELPALNDYAKIMHAKGKKLLIHMCGKLNMVIDKIAESEFDGIIDVSPAPTGDCNFPEAASKMKEHGKIIAGGIECNAYASGDNQKFNRDVKLFAEQLSPFKNFWLGSGDAVPLGATVENLTSAHQIAGNVKR
jgi:uroporphyrinogen-III decarboxylase